MFAMDAVKGLGTDEKSNHYTGIAVFCGAGERAFLRENAVPPTHKNIAVATADMCRAARCCSNVPDPS